MSGSMRCALAVLLVAGILPAACMMDLGGPGGYGGGRGPGGGFGGSEPDAVTAIVGFPGGAPAYWEEDGRLYGQLTVGDVLRLAVVRSVRSAGQRLCTTTDTLRDVGYRIIYPDSGRERGDTAYASLSTVSNGVAYIHTAGAGRFGVTLYWPDDAYPPADVPERLYACYGDGGQFYVEMVRVNAPGAPVPSPSP